MMRMQDPREDDGWIRRDLAHIMCVRGVHEYRE